MEHLRKYLLIGVFFHFFCNGIFSQENDFSINVFVKNAIVQGQPEIKIKWLYDNLLIEGGWNVYRKSDNGSQEWQKLNNQPIVLGNIQLHAQLKDELPLAFEMIPRDFSRPQGAQAAYLVKTAVFHDKFAQYLGLRWNDKSVQNGQAYIYKIESARDKQLTAESKSIQVGQEESLEIKDVEISYHNEEEVAFRWKPEPEKYFGVNVYRSELNKDIEKRLNDLPVLVFKYLDENQIYRYQDVFFEDTTVQLGHHYEYVFRPIDAFGEEGKPSEKLSVRIGSKTPPAPPTIEEIEVIEHHPIITWQGSIDKDIKHYEIWRSTKPRTKFIKVFTTDSGTRRYEDEALKHGRYYYRIYAVDEDNNHSDFDDGSILVEDIIPPHAPTNIQVTRKGNVITVNWDPIVDNDFYGYRVFLGRQDYLHDSQFSLLHHEMLQETNFTFELNDSIASKFIVAVGAYDKAHNASKFIRSDFIEFEDVIKPEPPHIIKIHEENDIIHLDWLPNHHHDVVGYMVYRRHFEQEEEWKLLTAVPLNTNETHWSGESIHDGVEMEYAVVAIDDAGHRSDFSESVVLHTQADDEVIVHEPEKNMIRVDYQPLENRIRISWNDKKLKEIKGFILFRAENEGSFVPITSLIQDEYYYDTDFDFGSTYHYEVRFYTPDHHFGKFDSEAIHISNSKKE